MNGEIKFRGFFKGVQFPIDKDDLYDYEKPQMIYDVHKLYDGSGVKDNAVLGGYSCFNSVLEDSHFSVMQFTGLHDKNGIEIYIGDIVKMHVFIEVLGEGLGVKEGEIELIGQIANEKLGLWIQCEKEEDCGYLLWFNGLHEESFEIIGNIYENPELLNGSAVA
jgi:uncharacterized phage protein (TIGR01671 family)